MSKDRIPGVYRFSELPEPSSEDLARFEEKAARRRERRAKQEEEDRRRDAEEQQRRINNGAATLKLAPSQLTEPEVEALAWAITYFQDNQDELTREGSKNYPIKEYRRYLAHAYDEYRLSPESVFRHIHFTDPSFFENVSELIEFCAFMTERGEPLPEKLRAFGAAVLRENRESLTRRAAVFREKGESLTLREFTAGFAQRITERFKGVREKRSGKRGPAAGDWERRDHLIKVAVRYIVERWRLNVTRNKAAMERGGKASAATVVWKALKAAKVRHMEEKSVNDICDRGTEWVRYWPIMEGDSAFRNLASRSVRKVNAKPEG